MIKISIISPKRYHVLIQLANHFKTDGYTQKGIKPFVEDAILKVETSPLFNEQYVVDLVIEKIGLEEKGIDYETMFLNDGRVILATHHKEEK